MKKILLFIILSASLTNIIYGQTPSTILGKIIEIEGEYLFIDAEDNKNIRLGMIFGIYSAENEAIGICEISKIIKDGNYIARVLTQSDEIKKGYTVLADVEREFKLREKIKNFKTTTDYLDSYKKFSASANNAKDTTSFNLQTIKDQMLGNIFCQSMQHLGLQIPKFSNSNISIIPLNIYRDVLDESSKLDVDKTSGQVDIEVTINIGKLKRRLQSKGYSFKPKIVRLVFPKENDSEIIRKFIGKILKYSSYIAEENEELQDVTSPVSCIIYSSPQIFADEIKNIEFEDISISISKVYEDTIELNLR